MASHTRCLFAKESILNYPFHTTFLYLTHPFKLDLYNQQKDTGTPFFSTTKRLSFSIPATWLSVVALPMLGAKKLNLYGFATGSSSEQLMVVVVVIGVSLWDFPIENCG